jgi:pimeloyl-[acyl-carrier protein] methyl ester esterase
MSDLYCCLDGTGELFSEFLTALPEEFRAKVVLYPADRFLSYFELESLVRAACPFSEPFVLLAESFSTPLAIKYAASKPSGLVGLILCTGFATSPVRGWRRLVGSLLAPIMFYVPLPSLAAERWLVGADVPPSLLKRIRSVVASVPPQVLSSRLRDVFACDVRSELGQIDVPILYIRAERDRLVGPECLAELLRSKPQISVVTIEGPHLLLQREPHRAAEAVASFVASLPRESAL